jgi:DNA topoisomerase-1
VLRSPARVASVLDRDQLRLYTMIWQRTVASQMAEARFDQVGIDIEATDDDVTYGLRATGQTLLFDGFIRVYTEGRDDQPDEDAEARLPELFPEQILRMLQVLPEQHFTQPPPRFTAGSGARQPTRRSSPRSRTVGTCASRTSGSSPRTSAKS